MQHYIFFLLILLATFAYGAMIEVLPTSYSFDCATDVGSYQYHDWTGRQLIDSVYGIAPWSADLGNGNAYEWVGWCNDPIVNIIFDFSTAKPVHQISIGTVQDNLVDVVIPSFDIYSSDGSTWTLRGTINIPESSTYDNTHQTITFSNLNINARYIKVVAKHSLDGPWTFIDEVDFYQDTVVIIPEPGTGLLLILGLIGLCYRKRS